MSSKVVVHVSASLLLSACSDHAPYDAFGGRCTIERATAQCTASAQARTAALTVCGDLTADNTLNVSSSSASAALWVRGNARTTSPLTVNGNYWSGTNQATNTQTVTGATLTGQTLPCAPVDVAPLRSSPSEVQLSEPTTATLGCNYVHTMLDVNNTFDVEVEGALTWYIEGDLHIAAPMRVTLAPGASLQFVIGGALEIDNTFEVGGADVEATTVRVAGPVRIAAPTVLHGSLVAGGRVDANNTLTVDGAAYVGPLKVASPVVIRGETAFSEDGCTTQARSP